VVYDFLRAFKTVLEFSFDCSEQVFYISFIILPIDVGNIQKSNKMADRRGHIANGRSGIVTLIRVDMGR
jgi:hypothetical protein